MAAARGPRWRWLASAGNLLTGALLCVSGVAFLIFAVMPADLATEVYLAGAVGFVLLLLARRSRQGWRRALVLMLCLLLTLRYFSWRVTETFVYYDPASLIAALLLMAAEVYSFVLTLLGLFVNFAPITRPVAPAPSGGDVPRVDILVPSYNESPELLAVTLCAAGQITYPDGRCQVHLLDDGGTDQKCSDPNPARAAAARERRRTLQALCARFGAVYHTRARNHHAKAGNINDALSSLSGDLVLILDADHVPTADILSRTVPLFQADSNLFLVQTPHFFTNPDTIEKNLGLFQKMPGENEVFHRAIQSGLDFWNSTIFCGSAALLHRARLLEVGGIATNTITEDAETALALHARGYRSACVAHPMVAGLAPETFVGMVTQQVRWAQGMIQIFLLCNPLGRRGLTVAQRIGYLSCILYWLFPFARLIFLAAPIAYLVFGLRIYAANATGVLVFVLPHMVASLISSDTLFGRFRWPIIPHIYETLLGLLILRPLWATLRNPRAPNFKVTPKGEQVGADFISPLAVPFYVVCAITLAALPIGLWRLANEPTHRDTLLITLFWEMLNALLLLGALGALFERRQRRAVPRLAANMPAALLYNGERHGGRIVDLSMGGARFDADGPVGDPAAAGRLEIEVVVPHVAGPVRLRVHVRTQQPGWVGLAFAADDAQFGQIVRLVHGDSGRWSAFWSDSARSTGVWTAITILPRAGMAALALHGAFLARRAVAALPVRRRRSSILPTELPNGLGSWTA